MTTSIERTALHGRHPETVELVGWLNTDHLPPHLREVSEPFEALAWRCVSKLGDGAELSAALRKILEAKDCAVRQATKDGRDAATPKTAPLGWPIGRPPQARTFADVPELDPEKPYVGRPIKDNPQA